MFIRVTNARTGKMVTANPNMIGLIRDNEGSKYPNTNAVIIMNDSQNSFIPCIETEDQIHQLIASVSGNTANRRPMREEPPVNEDVR